MPVGHVVRPFYCLLGFVVLAGRAAAPEGPPTSAEKARDPKAPLVLEIKAPSRDVRVDDKIEVEYVLTNVTADAIDGCAEGWNNYSLQGTKTVVAMLHRSIDGVPTENCFRIPPRAKLVWTVDVTINPEAGLGPAELYGRFSSAPPGWSGSLLSRPVRLIVNAK